ncbi:hypothetical protein [Nesterenkonia cremea]|uniref:Uncharacterized protein n=1 Tax=Nesterenkonia cremea TaxID=1882340 RepID=A0A917ASH9_9MICC|nr:hypothetical protein [Nesterenkonia cremea]GGE70004.1 hypothetical protein GCM10011401_16670 [Nesterenkonia cremea]
MPRSTRSSPLELLHDDVAPDAQSPQEARNHYRAVILFPISVLIGLIGAVAGLLFPAQVGEGSFLTNPLLGMIMFGMGLTVRPADFLLVLKKPLPVLLVVLMIAQYANMPLRRLSRRRSLS